MKINDIDPGNSPLCRLLPKGSMEGHCMARRDRAASCRDTPRRMARNDFGGEPEPGKWHCHSHLASSDDPGLGPRETWSYHPGEFAVNHEPRCTGAKHHEHHGPCQTRPLGATSPQASVSRALRHTHVQAIESSCEPAEDFPTWCRGERAQVHRGVGGLP